MGFFDSIVEDSTSTTAATTAAQGTSTVTDTSVTPLVVSDSSVSFDSSDLVILDDTPSISTSSSDSASQIPNTVGEMFLTAEDVVMDGTLSEASVSEDVVPEINISEISIPEVVTSESVPSEPMLEKIEEVTPGMTEFVESAMVTETMDFSAPSIMETPVYDSISVGNPVSSSANDEVIDIDATLKKTIAELEANAQKIQAKADEAFARESDLLEEKNRREAEHKAEMKKLQQAAQDARKSGEEIKKSGDRTSELIKLLQSQVAA